MNLVERLRKVMRSLDWSDEKEPIQEAIDRIEQLESEVAKWKTTAELHKENYDVLIGDLRMKLAEREATIQKLKEALVIAEGVFRDYARLHAEKEQTQENAKKVERNLHFQNICEQALSTPSSTEALDAYFTKRLNELMAKAYPSANGKG